MNAQRQRAQLRLSDGLRALESAHLLRRRRTRERALLNFCSNDYLGLSRHPQVIEAMVRSAERDGVGSGASHLISGHSREHELLELELAAFLGRERALLFSTGYMANLGTVAALLERDAVVLQDSLNHASLIDAAVLSKAQRLRYAHNDVAEAAALLEAREHESPAALITDGVFSMDGDLAPLPALAQLATQHGAWLVVDDAHGIGVLGEHGGGCVEHYGLNARDVPVLIGTLGKAFGTFGAVVAGDALLCDWLVQKSRTYIYTTALPPAIAAATRASLSLIQSEPWRRDVLRRHIARFREHVVALGLQLMPSHTPIQPLLLGSSERALAAAAALEQSGLWVSAIRAPTVPKDTARLRITFSAAHTDAEVDRLCDALTDLRQQGLV